jgi:hypothetical protein
MSQKSSVPQATKFVSQALKQDKLAFLLTNEALDMGLINRIEAFYGLLNLRVR